MAISDDTASPSPGRKSEVGDERFPALNFRIWENCARSFGHLPVPGPRRRPTLPEMLATRRPRMMPNVDPKHLVVPAADERASIEPSDRRGSEKEVFQPPNDHHPAADHQTHLGVFRKLVVPRHP